MIKKIKSYLKDKELPKWFKILNLSILLPILLWPLIFFATIFFFDNPHNLFYTFLLFLFVNAYPFYLAILALINIKLYTWNKLIGLILPIIFLGAASFCIGYYIYNIYDIGGVLIKNTQLEIQNNKNGILGNGFIKKNNQIFLNDTIIKGADAETFEIISYDWSKDKSHYYYFGKPVHEIDYSSFKFLDYHYAKDKYHVFYDNIIIEGADAKTFYHIEGSQDGKDARNCYRYGEKVDCSVLINPI